jgi:8-oxo-dGTP diphosphatase
MNFICHHIEKNPDPYLAQLRTKALDMGDGCIANAIIRNSNDEILVRLIFPLCWDLPGGHINKGESLESGLVREVKEEIGVPLLSIDALIAHWSWTHPRYLKKRMQQFDFLATLGPKFTIQLNLEEFVESRWLAADELWVLQEYRSPDDLAMRDVLRHAFQLIGKPI